MKFSYRHLLLLLGIAVAAIITLMTLVYTESLPEATKATPALRKSSLNANPSVIVKKLLEKVDLTLVLRK